MVTQVKGVGRWTADMLLMFCLGRPDVLPVGDLGIRASMKEAYGAQRSSAAGGDGEDRRAVAAIPQRRILVPVAPL